MKRGEKMFINAVANTGKKLLTYQLTDAHSICGPVELLSLAVANRREELREAFLKEEDVEKRNELSAEYYNDLREFYRAYFEALQSSDWFPYETKLVPYLHYHIRYKKFFPYFNENEEIKNVLTAFEKRYNIAKYMLSGWSVYIFRLTRPLDYVFDVVDITDDTIIEEKDWDGLKSKKGIEIIRRNGECGNFVMVFVYLDENEGMDNAKLHFYSTSIDGEEIRHYAVPIKDIPLS